MEETQMVQNSKPGPRFSISLVLLLGLLVLRIPFLTGIALFSKISPPWLEPIFSNSTFLLTAVLIWWERKRLEEFHIGYGSLGIFILGPIIFSILLKVMSFSSTPQNYLSIPWLQIVIALSLLAALIVKRPNLQKVTVKSVIWIIVSVVIGLVIGALYGYVNSVVFPTQRGSAVTFPLFIFMFVRQITWAAALEEPLFRGFLWGYLKKAGWKDIWICFFQSGLFLVSHAYYITVNPIIFINVFIAAFILGLVAWKSRSIANSMTVHGLFNSVGDIVAHSSF